MNTTTYTQINTNDNYITSLKNEENISINTLQNDNLNLSILEHGIQVNQYFLDLYNHLQFNRKIQYNWKLPLWLIENKKFILEQLLPIGILSNYQIYHDIGKPYCKIYELDNQSKYHFPNHTEKSAEIWKSISPDNNIVKLISMDMDIHTMKAIHIDEFIKHNEAISLLITGLSEIHANAEMFGGIESTSFKIKYKQIDSRGKQIIKKLISIKGENNE